MACVADDPVPPLSGTAKDASPPAVDSGPPPIDAQADVDAGPFCDPSLPFGEPEVVTELSAAGSIGDFVARLSADGLVVYFGRVFAGGDFRLFRARRSSRQEPFASPEEVTGIGHSPNEYDSHPFPLPDGTGLYFQRSTDGGTGRDIMISGSNGDGFRMAATVTGLSDPALLERSPYLWNGEMWLDVQVAGATERRLARAPSVRIPDWFGSLDVIDAGAGPGELDIEPVVAADGLTIYFGSNRDAGAGDSGAGGVDIWRMRRSQTDAGWGAPELFTKLATPADESPSWISPDDCELYFHRLAGAKYQIMRATRR